MNKGSSMRMRVCVCVCWRFLARKMRNVFRSKCGWMDMGYTLHLCARSFSFNAQASHSVSLSVCLCVCKCVCVCIWISSNVQIYIESVLSSVMRHQSKKRKEHAVFLNENTLDTVETALRKLISPEDSSFISVSNADSTWLGNGCGCCCAQHNPTTEPNGNVGANEWASERDRD